jgi:hypothetical protein
MGLHEIALLFKLDHLVANSSRAHAQSLASYDVRTHRDALGYIFANYDAEDSIPSSSYHFTAPFISTLMMRVLMLQ